MEKKKLEKLFKTLNTINEREEGIFAFELMRKTDDNGFEHWIILDFNEEFYYDGYAFERIYDELENTVKEVFGKQYYLECECPGRWVVTY